LYNQCIPIQLFQYSTNMSKQTVNFRFVHPGPESGDARRRQRPIIFNRSYSYSLRCSVPSSRMAIARSKGLGSRCCGWSQIRPRLTEAQSRGVTKFCWMLGMSKELGSEIENDLVCVSYGSVRAPMTTAMQAGAGYKSPTAATSIWTQPQHPTTHLKTNKTP
jgi:hypothetical protein